MSLAIDVNEVTGVLLADGWHEVHLQSFMVDSYEYLDGPLPDALLLHGGGASDVCATGFRFREGTELVEGPLTAILAVRSLAPRSG